VPGPPPPARARNHDQWAPPHRDRHTPAHLPAHSGRPVQDVPGIPAWGALLVLVGLAGIGGLIDTAISTQWRGAFNIGIVLASAIAIIAVRRTEMLPIVLAPPIVYSGAAMVMLYIRSGGLHNKSELINAALNYLVYGFPAIATATATVLLIAAFRMLSKR
jgi:hypothetical protein